MKFRTQIDIPTFDKSIDYSQQILSLGSCFAEAVGGRLQRAKFRAVINPTGVLFNPASISATLRRFAECRYVEECELQQGSKGWFHYDFHSSLSNECAKSCVEGINQRINIAHTALRNSQWLIITLGTSWVYELAHSAEIVANCHKLPSATFKRRRLSVGEIVELLKGALSEIVEHKRVILTLSPIRHLSDGLAENSLSKSTLRVAIEELVALYPESIYYFPSYEIFMDDLRDYRFYGEDMVHPSKVGVDYVWERFCKVALSLESREVMARVESIIKGVEHRAYRPQSEAYKRFCQSQLRAIESIDGCVDLASEREYFAKGLEM